MREESQVFAKLDAILGRDVESMSDSELQTAIEELQAARTDSLSVSRASSKPRATGKKGVSASILIKELAEQSGKSEEQIIDFLKKKGVIK